jgi:hypothetical protein
MKKIFLVLLTLCAFAFLASCARYADTISYADSKGYSLVTVIDSEYIFTKDGKVYYAEGTGVFLKKNVPSTTYFVEIAGLQPRGIYININK